MINCHHSISTKIKEGEFEKGIFVKTVENIWQQNDGQTNQKIELKRYS